VSWINRPDGTKFIADNPSVKFWLSRITKPRTRDAYGQDLLLFCRWAKLTPEQLMEIRNTHKDQLAETRKKLGLPQPRNGNDDGGYVILDLLQNFILTGEVEISRTYSTGKTTKHITKIAECAKKYKSALYYAILSYFLYNRVGLPRDKFTISDTTKRTEAKTKYMPLEDARPIIAASRSPYKELFTMQLYSGMGSGEILSLNELWPVIKEQLDKGRETIQIDFSYRKTNPNPYFTFCPASLFEKFKHIAKDAVPFHTNRGKAIGDADILAMWKNSRKRAGITKRYTPHMFRDLFSTNAEAEAKMSKDYIEFCMGHKVDPNDYKQLYEKPDKVMAEWAKWRAYLDGPIAASQEQLAATQEQLNTVSEIAKGLLTDKLDKLEIDIKAIEDDLPTLHDPMIVGPLKARLKGLIEERDRVKPQLAALA
jgi:integrase